MTILLYKDGRLVIDESDPLEGVSLDGLVACISNPQSGDVLTYDGTMFINKAQNILPIEIEDPQEGDVLTYDGSIWVNKQPETPETPDDTEPAEEET